MRATGCRAFLSICVFLIPLAGEFREELSEIDRCKALGFSFNCHFITKCVVLTAPKLGRGYPFVFRSTCRSSAFFTKSIRSEFSFVFKKDPSVRSPLNFKCRGRKSVNSSYY